MSWAVRITNKEIDCRPRRRGAASRLSAKRPGAIRASLNVVAGIDFYLSAGILVPKRKLPPLSIRRVPPVSKCFFPRGPGNR